MSRTSLIQISCIGLCHIVITRTKETPGRVRCPCNIGDKLFNIGFVIIKKDCQQKFVWLDSIWVFPKMVVSPKHPKMIGFVGETHHLRKPLIFISANLPSNISKSRCRLSSLPGPGLPTIFGWANTPAPLWFSKTPGT